MALLIWGGERKALVKGDPSQLWGAGEIEQHHPGWSLWDGLVEGDIERLWFLFLDHIKYKVNKSGSVWDTFNHGMAYQVGNERRNGFWGINGVAFEGAIS